MLAKEAHHFRHQEKHVSASVQLLRAAGAEGFAGLPQMTASPDLPRRLAAELVGTAGLLATAVGSGTKAERLTGGNAAVAGLGNTTPTGAITIVLILVFAPVSGAHFNPAVNLGFFARRELPRSCKNPSFANLFLSCAFHAVLDHKQAFLDNW